MELHLSSPAFKANPYPAFAYAREQEPVHILAFPDGQRAWLITRYEDADAVLRDQRFVKNIRHVLSLEELMKMFPERRANTASFSDQMLSADPPVHTRLRSLINLSFTPRLVEQWRERIQAIAEECIDRFEGKSEADLIEAFSFPLPMMVITEMLGVPAEDHVKFRVWSNEVLDATGNPRDFEKLREHMMAFYMYLLWLIQEKRQNPAQDLLSQLIQAREAGDSLSVSELISTIFLLIVTGHETTVNLISNGMLALLLHPDQVDLLKQQPEWIKTAIEEFLRYQGPLMTATQRWAREDLEFAGQKMSRGDAVYVVLASANRDPQAFSSPETLDITRAENRHLAFGKGIHYCLGAPLARLEGQIAISTLLRRLPNLRLNADPQTLTWRPGILLMGLDELPVAF